MQNLLNNKKKVFEDFFFSKIFSLIQESFHPDLAEACFYSLKAGGKRIRPILVLLSSNSESSNSLFLASAVECIHTYSLIHDDLPAMDNDDFRRGIATNHKKFSESTAILAGDALNSFSYYLLSKVEKPTDPFIYRDLLEILHFGSGGPGMVSGQIEDLIAEKSGVHNDDVLLKIHSLKTGALIVSSLLLGNRLREDYKEREETMKKYGEGLGILFQITDDILDEESTLSELGKTPGKDQAKGKLTYPSLYGMDKAKKIRNEVQKNLENIAEQFHNPEDNYLKVFPSSIAQRKN